jgi:hypothetical protein
MTSARAWDLIVARGRASALGAGELVDLGGDDGVGAVDATEPRDELEFLVLDAASRVDEHEHPAQGGPALHVVLDVPGPRAALVRERSA